MLPLAVWPVTGTNIIGLLLPEIGISLFTPMLRGIEQGIRDSRIRPDGLTPPAEVQKTVIRVSRPHCRA
jgi:hypothetical protein